MEKDAIPEVVELEIEDIAFGGSGVGRVDGLAVFVPFTEVGERIQARIVRRKKSYAEGEMVALVRGVAHREAPPCRYFGQCGGCAYQHLPYGRQLEVKAAQVEQMLRRIGRIDPVPMRPMVASPQPLGYRNRVTVHRDGNVTGFFAAGGMALLDIERCAIASDVVNDQLKRLRRGHERDGRFTLSEKIGGPGFVQVNAGAAEQLAGEVERLAPGSGELLVDAYCGAGFFLKRLAHRFRRAIGIEWSAASLAKARKEADEREEYLEGDVAVRLEEVLTDPVPGGTFLILDPPSKGLEPRVIRTLLDRPVPQAAYISCNPGTLARDLARLSERYRVAEVTPVDMFAQTAEIEVLVSLERIG